MSTLYEHPTDKSSEYDDESYYPSGNGEYRGKNYSPRHRKYYRTHHRNKYNNKQFYRDDNKSAKYTTTYRKRSPNRSPRHLKARALHAVRQARIEKYCNNTSSANNAAQHEININNDDENYVDHNNNKFYESTTLPHDEASDLHFINEVNEQKSYEQTENEHPQQQDCEEKEIECDPSIMDLPDFQLEMEELECFQNVSLSTMHSLLDEQRLQNGSILAKLHCDQEQFLNVCQEYENQNDLLKREIIKYEQENEGITDKVQMIQNILIEHKNENLIQNEEVRQSEIVKASLWEAVSTNMTLLQQVNELNHQIDSYHVLIAKKSQQLTILEKERAKKEKEKEEKESETNGNDNDNLDDDKETITNSKIESKDTPFDAMSVGTLNTNWFDFPLSSELESRMDEEDILKSYADQLVSKNQRYHEILKLLRNKVDELRDTRTRL